MALRYLDDDPQVYVSLRIVIIGMAVNFNQRVA
jgi:hypothetical protein